MRTLALATLLLSPVVLAQDRPVDSPRVFGQVGFLAGWSNVSDANGPGLGLSAGLGAQLNDRFAVSAQLRAGTIVVMSFGAAFAQFEYSPVDLFSIGVGVGAHVHHALISQKLTVLPTVPLSFAVNLPGRREDGKRYGWRIGADFAISPAVTAASIPFWAGLSIGGVWR